MRKRENRKTLDWMRWKGLSKIECIYKALHQKQRVQQGVLVILLLLAMLSVSICVSVFTRSDSIISRIDDMDATHTAVISGSPEGMYQFLDIVQEEKGLFDYYEKTNVFPYVPYSGSSFQGNFPFYIEGYVESDAQYPVLEGKALKDLKDNEIAVMQSYAEKLQGQGVEPIGHQEVITDYETQKMYTFKIVSIMEYPNYDQGYSSQSDLDKVDMFTIKKSAVAIGNFDTMEHLAKESVFGNAMAKIRFKDYSEQAEYQLRNRMNLDYTYLTGQEFVQSDFRLLAEEMNSNKIMNGIFQFVSLCVTICILVSSCFVLYAYMKRKLIKDQETLSLMFMNGVHRRNIRNAYLLEMIQIFIQAFLCNLMVLFLMQIIVKYSNRYDLLLLFRLSLKGWLWIIGCTLVFLFVLLTMMTLQVRSCFKGNLIRTIRSRSLHLKHHKGIAYRYQSLQMSLRDILTTPWSSLRSIFSLSFIFATLLILITTSSILFNLYTPQTFGLSFDYMLTGPIAFSSFEEIEKQYVDTYVFAQTQDVSRAVYRCFLVDNQSHRDENLYHYYPGLVMFMEGPLEDFLPLKKGEYPKEADEKEIGDRAYTLSFGLTTRRLEQEFGLYTIQDEKVKEDSSLRTKTYMEYSFGNQIEADQIQGFTESIINNGYIDFFRKKRRPLNEYWYPEIPTTLLRLKDPLQAKEFEKTLKEKKIAYIHYDEVLSILQENNNEMQSRLFAIMAGVALLTILVGCMTIYANIQSDIEEKRREESYLLKLGWQKKMQKKRLFLHETILLCASMLMGSIWYIALKIPYGQMLSEYLGLYTLPSGSLVGLIVLVFLCLMGICALFKFGRHHRKGHQHD